MASTPFNLDHYARQQFKTPGALLTLDLASRLATPDAASRALEVACGTGEAASILAERHGCRVFGVDPHRSSLRFATARARHRRLRRLVAFAIADGRSLPVTVGRFDLALCIGAPSIVGLPECWREMARALRPGGWVVVSDAVLTGPPPQDGAGWPEWVADLLTFDAYAAGLAEEGLRLEAAELLPESVWDEYHAPMRGMAAEIRRYRAGEVAAVEWADGIEAMVRAEQAALPALAYAHFAGRRG